MPVETRRIPLSEHVYTPWGLAQYITSYSEDVAFYSTARHGGFKVKGAAYKKIPIEYRNTFVKRVNSTDGYGASTKQELERSTSGWFEEDCDSAIVITYLSELFDSEQVENAKAMMQWLRENAGSVHV